MNVLVTDGNYKNALAAVRSLGEKGTPVIVGSAARFSVSFYSRYCSARFVYPDPRREQEFVQSIIEHAERHKIDVVLPIGYRTNVALSKYREEVLEHVATPVADWETMTVAANKDQTMKFAQSIGIGIPRTYDCPEQVHEFPVVVKGVTDSGFLRYVNSAKELSGVAVADCVIQDYIPGQGYGFFALCNKGQVRAIFMHKRLREYPVTGGPSTAAESIYDEDLRQTATRLLEGLKWHGVAMAEFKKDDRDGQFKLMEINPKFWGSLDLSIAAGVDFPYLAARLALDGDIEPVTDYRVGLRYSWPFPYDVMHVIARPASLPRFVCDLFSRGSATNVRFSDFKPNLFQMLSTGPLMAARIKRRELIRPHGRPRRKG